MSWLGWVAIGILIFDAAFFGFLYLVCRLERRGRK